MLQFLSHLRPRAEPNDSQADSALTLPWPVTEKSKQNSHQHHHRSKSAELRLEQISISPPIPRSSPSSLTGFDDFSGYWHPSQYSPSTNPSPSRAGPSNVAWINSNNSSYSSDEWKSVPQAAAQGGGLPAVIRLDSRAAHVHPIGRSVSSPPASPSYEEGPSSSSSQSVLDQGPTNKWGLKLHTDSSFTASTQSLRLDPGPLTFSTDVFGHAYSYPLAKQLSPIAEQDYFSPESLRITKPLPNNSDRDVSASASVSYSQTNPSPGGSHTSEIARPSPVYSSPFITRHLNRTISQTSSRTHVSTSSSVPRLSSKSPEPPIIPPLDLKPPFPGPHPNQSSNNPTLRPRKSTVVTMPTIIGSSEGYHESEYTSNIDDRESLHAESFVTATSENDIPEQIGMVSSQNLYASRDGEEIMIEDLPADAQSARSGHSRFPSASESFITRRWDRDAALGLEIPTFRAKRQWITVTPAFWAFWLGFLCPFLWLIGGWHFTNFGEQPPRLTFWEFYFNAAFWKERFCAGRSKKKGVRTGKVYPPLPRWVAEKQVSDDGRARLNDPKRSLRGISFGYPFIPRPVTISRRRSLFIKLVHRILAIIEKPNRILDHLYGIKLKEVRGRPESGRRMFDPWIQRCRYAFCYALILLSIALCATSTYLIVFNTRQLR